jgi:transcription antitermination factor NusG
MSKLHKEYDVADGNGYILHIAPNYSENKLGYKANERDPIFVEKKNEEEFLTFSVNEAKEIINALTEIVDVIENAPEPVIGDTVTILSGRFAGMTGRIIDIDEVETEKELVVRIDETDESEDFIAYIDKTNVE